MNLWLYERFVVKRLSWPFIIHDFCMSFSVGLEKSISTRLKKWAGLFRSADAGSLFGKREDFGLQLTSVSNQFASIKCSMLESSKDETVAELFKLKSDRPI